MSHKGQVDVWRSASRFPARYRRTSLPTSATAR
jgi:hypothetical protein